MRPTFGRDRFWRIRARWGLGLAFTVQVKCGHNEYRSFESSYDHRRGVLVFFWRCERCGARLQEARRMSYHPQYDPGGNDRFLGAFR
jgi:hypothetical protein